MAFTKLYNLLAITTLALFAASFNATPVTALATGHQHLNRQVAHEGLARRSKRASTARCKQRPSSSLVSSSAKATSTKAAATEAATSVAKSTTPTPAPPKTTSTKAAAPPKTSAAPAAATKPASTGSTSSGVGKIGIGWNGGNDPSLGNIVSSNTHYIYTWSPYEPTNLFGLEFIPMLWGTSQVSVFNQLVVPGYAKNLLFVNEPNQVGQAQMSPQDAATLWQQQFQNKQSEGYSLWSPAVTNAADGETWMDSFLGACTGCGITHMALHWYDTSADNFKSYVQHWNQKYGLPIVVTEFACQNFGSGAQATMDEVWAFYQDVIPWVMSQDYIEAVFPFGFLEDMGNVNPDNQLMKNGQLTDLGNYIVHGPY